MTAPDFTDVAATAGDTDKFIIGTTLLALQSEAKKSETTYINRRVEKLEILDTRAVRWRVSVDFRVPDLAPPCPSGPPGYRLVPLTQFPKEDLAAFDLRDEQGNVLWFPTAAELSPLLAPPLIEMARLALAVPVLDSDIKDRISKIVTEPQQDHEKDYLPFGAAAERIDTEARRQRIQNMIDELSGTGANTALKFSFWLARKRAEKRAKKADEQWEALAYPHKDQVLTLIRTEKFRSLLEELAQSYMAFAAIESAAGSRRVLKFSWERSMEFQCETSKLRRLLQSLGWRRWPFRVIVGGNGGSYNLEVTAPAGVNITSITVKSKDPDNQGRYPRVTCRGYTPHVSARVPPAGAGRYVATAYLRICPGGWLPATLAVTVVIAAAMWMGWADLGTLFSLPDPAATEEADTTATLLSALLAVIATWLVRPGEHPLASRLLLVIRVLLGLDAIDVLIGTGYLLQRGASGRPDRSLWLGLAITAAVIAAIVFGSWLITATLSTWGKGVLSRRRVVG